MQRSPRLIVFIAMLLTASHSSAQTVSIGDARMIKAPINLVECNFNGTPVVPASNQSIPVNSNFNIVNQTTNDYVIKFWDWAAVAPAPIGPIPPLPLETAPQKRARLNYSAIGAYRYFLLPKNLVVGSSVARYHLFSATIGTLTLPTKYRPQSGLFEKTFNLAITGGVRLLFSKTDPNHAIGLTLGVGPSSVVVNSKNTTPASGVTVVDGDRGAITISINLVYQWERLQIGLSAGKDFLLDGNEYKWHYQGDTWLSLGIGVNIFTEDKPSTASSGSN